MATDGYHSKFPYNKSFRQHCQNYIRAKKLQQKGLVALLLKWHAFPTELPWQVLIDGYLTPLLFMYQLTFGLKRIQLKLIEHDYIRIFKVSVFQAMRISTVGKAWNCNRRATNVLGCQVWSLLEATFLLNLFCSKSRMIYFSETLIALTFGHKLLIMNHITVM